MISFLLAATIALFGQGHQLETGLTLPAPPRVEAGKGVVQDYAYPSKRSHTKQTVEPE